ncbi:MAG: putative lipid II flippase FtsW [Patescibacteria group bacterium]
MFKAKRTPAVDYIFISLSLVIVGIGLLLLSSASSVVSFQKFGSSYYYVQRQLIYGLLPGIFFFILLSKIDYHRLVKYALPLFIVSIGALVAVLIPGVGSGFGGASRWLDIGIFSFQPSEIVKLSLILYLAYWFDKKGVEEIRTWKHGTIPFVILLSIVSGLLIMQPDMGTMMVIAVTVFVLYFLAGARLLNIFSLMLAGSGLLYFLIKIAPYRLSRLTVFFNPGFDPQGIGYHINQALLAVGSGGFWGLGLGHSRQKYQYLPEVTGDSIFAVVAEELGFLLTAVLIILLVALILRGLKMAKQAPDNLGRLLASGIMIWLGLQIFINIAAMLNLIPLTGIPLPFISHGGTALVVALASLGIIVNISSQARVVETRR